MPLKMMKLNMRLILMNKAFLLAAILTLTSSCSLLLKQAYDEDRNRIDLLPQTPPKLYCEAQEASSELVGPSLKNQETFWQFLRTVEVEKLDSAERFTLWVLLNFDLRPDKVSPFAGVRLFESNGDNLEYREFRQGGTPLLFALNDLLKRQGSKQSPLKLAQFMGKNYQRPLFVDEELEVFLENNKKILWETSEFRDLYFKDNQTLKTGETLPRYKIFTQTSTQTLTSNQHEILSQKKSFFCDHDSGIYEGLPQKTITIPEVFPKPLVLGFKQGRKSYLIVVEQELKFGQIKNGPFHTQATVPEKLAPFCYFPLPHGQLLLTAYGERDPGQFLSGLSKKITHSLSQKDEIAKILSTPRQLILFHPTRILLEADNNRLSQSKDKDLEKLFSGSYPIFQATKLAQVNALFLDPSMKESGFVTDKRLETTISCQDKRREKNK